MQRTYDTAAFPDFEGALDTFRSELGEQPSRAVIALAGPVDADGGELTNRRSWEISRAPLQARGIHATFINDFEALAYGVAHATPADYTVLQEGKAEPRAAIALVGAGTGLGVGALVWDGKRYRACASEGGHIGFAPQGAQQLELWRHLAARHGRVSAERVVSGPGLLAIYAWMCASAQDDEPVAADAAEVAALALRAPTSLAARALDLFVACYGAVAGDIALAFLARGGIYVCGGVAAKLAQRLAAPDFLAAFREKGRHRNLMASMPIRLVLNEHLGLIGAAYAPAD